MPVSKSKRRAVKGVAVAPTGGGGGGGGIGGGVAGEGFGGGRQTIRLGPGGAVSGPVGERRFGTFGGGPGEEAPGRGPKGPPLQDRGEGAIRGGRIGQSIRGRGRFGTFGPARRAPLDLFG